MTPATSQAQDTSLLTMRVFPGQHSLGAGGALGVGMVQASALGPTSWWCGVEEDR